MDAEFQSWEYRNMTESTGFRFIREDQVVRWESDPGKTSRRLMVSSEAGGFRYRWEEVHRDLRASKVLEFGNVQPTRDVAIQEALDSPAYGDEIKRAVERCRMFDAVDVRHVK
jgi:hypothetical protein